MVPQVMMYCTGGIRCERASALLDHMEKATGELNTQGIYMVRGGIERYLKTFPEGGYWSGKNYLFDRRFEQVGAELHEHYGAHARGCPPLRRPLGHSGPAPW